MSQRITATQFSTMLSRLGVRGPALPFELEPFVVPISIVDLDVPLTISNPVLAGSASEGEITSAGAGALLADSGAQAAGNYFAVMLVNTNQTGSVEVRLQRRDSANAADIWAQRFTIDAVVEHRQFSYRIRLEQGERLRVLTVGAAGVGSVIHANIWLVAT